MIEHGVGVREIATYTLSEINEEYFDQDAGSGTPVGEVALHE
jgi:hypothetical protein